MNSSGSKSGLNRIFGRYTGAVILVGLILVSYVIFKILRPETFGQPNQVLAYFQQCLIDSVGAVGLYFIIVMGLFDFSLGANCILCAIVGTVFMKDLGLGYAGFLIAPIVCGALVGLINGIAYIKLHIPSMIVTTGLALIYESVGYYVSGDVQAFLTKEQTFFGHVPGNLIIACFAFLLSYVLLVYTKVGTYAYAIGSNEAVAKNMGIDVKKYKVLTFVITGFFDGLMGILAISYGSSMAAITGMASMSRNFAPTMGCFFGLAFRQYGIPIPAIIVGEFLIQIVYNGFVTLGAPTAVQNVVTGVALLLVVAFTMKPVKGEIVK
ncbi:MAG: ABC transporter permease [Lachnospiraceae bacterium]|nr:ABC transporter permease [Lachnospiraceae bacterium]